MQPEDTEHELLQLSSKRDMSRREALSWLVAGFAAASAGCLKEPGDPIVPYAATPPGLTPGQKRVYATSMVLDGFATGLLVTSRDGRPTKIDGNPLHPASLGATTPQQQASVLDLYDPARAKSLRHEGVEITWERLASELAKTRKGPLWLVLPPASSQTLAGVLVRLRERQRRVEIVYAGAPRRNTYEGARLAFGRALEPQLDFSGADVVVALDADPLSGMPMSLRWAREFAGRRRPSSPEATMNRLYVAEPMWTPTGSLSDQRLPIRPSEMTKLACALASELARRVPGLPALPMIQISKLAEELDAQAQAWARLAARDLAAHAKRSVVVVGERQPPLCHALAHVLNVALENLGTTVRFTDPVLLDAGGSRTIHDLKSALRAREVSGVAIFDANPVHSARDGEELSALLREAPLSLHYSPYENETSAACRTFVPASHYLESWGDGRAADGTLSFVQPLVRPLHATRSQLEVLAAFYGARGEEADARALVRASARPMWTPDTFEAEWQRALERGVVTDSARAVVPVQLLLGTEFSSALVDALSARKTGLELALSLSPHLHDGRFANNAWLEELPHPITKQTWGNAAFLSPGTALRIGAENEQVVRLRVGKRAVPAPVLIVPGHADHCVTLELGYGRSSAHEPVAHGLGTNAAPLIGESDALLRGDLSVERTNARVRLARTQDHFSDDGRGMARIRTLNDYRERPGLAHEQEPPPATLLGEVRAHGPQWAMTIDTAICTGCSSCVIACQAENNVPAVGLSDVLRGREMHWLRIDTYFVGEGAELVHQPMLCQHCEHAPCEYVCPVFATVHSPDGLNEMVYNRCIGTRFCSNNCPYKVRRFNWFHYTGRADTYALQRNPEVTVRERGVMEKCTYCVQRIRAAEARGRMEKRAIAPGEVTTACQDACPTRAIQFGALEHEQSDMVRYRREPRSYAVLNELGTRPRTVYLEKIKNPAGEPEFAP